MNNKNSYILSINNLYFHLDSQTHNFEDIADMGWSFLLFSLLLISCFLVLLLLCFILTSIIVNSGKSPALNSYSYGFSQEDRARAMKQWPWLN